MIQIINMSMIYPNGKGVFDINFAVQEGEVFGFLGPNGAGKTTTIRQLLGFTNATKGKCLISEMDTREKAAEIQNILGYLPGEIAFFENMKGSEFLNFMLELRGNPQDNRKDELLAYFELNPENKIRKMSKGMKQKLGLVTAFMHNPEILILDEPTSGLDPLMQRKFIALINEEKKRGKTILMSSHIFDEIERTCDRAAIIKDGRIVAIDHIPTLKQNVRKSYYVTFNNEQDIEKIKNAGFDYTAIDKCKFEIFIGKNLKLFLEVLSTCDVESLDASEQTLEQIFIHYYGEG